METRLLERDQLSRSQSLFSAHPARFAELWPRELPRFDSYPSHSPGLKRPEAQTSTRRATDFNPVPDLSSIFDDAVAETIRRERDGRSPRRRSFLRAGAKALGGRLSGPGGYYNLGNAIGLAAGIYFQVLAGGHQNEASLFGAATAYFFGDPSATVLTIAMVIFFWSGEIYHRAYSQPGAAVPLMRRADLLSALGALALSVSLALLGSILLAITSAVLLAGGKLGNALLPSTAPSLRFAGNEFDLFRVAVLISRGPAIAGIVAQLIAEWPATEPPLADPSIMQLLVLLGCYGLWLRADALLLRS